MRHTKRRANSLISLLLVCLMVFGIFPVNARAESDAATKWNTNLAPVQALNATLTETENGLHIAGNGNAWAMSSLQTEKNFTLETDVAFESGNVVNLIFGANSQTANAPSYVFKFDRTNYAQTKLFHYGNWSVYQSSTENSFTLNKESYHLKFEATDTEFVAYVDNAMVFKTNIPADYAGGYVGVGTAENSAVVFQNTICTTVNWITNLAPVQALNATLTESPKGLRITKNGGSDAWAMSRIRADKNFTLETDVSFESGNVVNLIFGANSRAANNPSYVFKFDRTNYAQTKLFHYGNWSVYQSSTENSFERNKERYKLKFEATDTEFIAYVDDAEVFRTNILADYAGGYIGIGVAENSTVVFQNTSYTATKWNTNLTPVQALNATLTETANGLHITGNGNAWAMSSIQADTDFTLETDVTFESGNVVNLIFGANSRAANNPSYVFKFNRTQFAETKLFHFGKWTSYQSSTENSFTLNKDSYHLKLEVTDTTIIAYVDNAEVFRTNIPADYAGGYIGVGAAESSTLVFQNTMLTTITPESFILGCI